MSSNPQSSLVTIAREILHNAEDLEAAAASRGHAAPSLDQWTLSDLTLEEEEVRKSLIDGCHRLKLLGSGPVGQFYDVAFNITKLLKPRQSFTASRGDTEAKVRGLQFTDVLSLRFLHENKLPAHIPDEGSIALADLASATQLDSILLRRFLHHAMINGLTQEPEPGYVSHTAASRLWKENDGLRDTIGFLIDDIGPGARFVLQAHRKWPNSAEPGETGFSIAENTSDPFYLQLAKDKERTRRFGNGMKFIAHADLYAFDIRHLINSFPWLSIDRPGAVIVDVGGGHGTVSRALHDVTQHIRFIVQDLPNTAAQGEESLPQTYSKRISFMAHDFFNPQPVKEADVYLFRWILHNWADPYAEKILRNMVAVMKPGSKIVVQEQMPDATSEGTRWSTKSKRNLDMIQAIGWNSLERTLPDWENLFRKVDSRFIFHGATTPTASCQTLILAELSEVPQTNGHADGTINVAF